MDIKIRKNNTRKNKKWFNICDIYNLYVEQTGSDTEWSVFKAVLTEFNRTVRDILLEQSGAFKMPHGLGLLCIGKYKPKHYNSKGLSIDFKTTRELGKIVYHLNEHSNGYKYRLFWSKPHPNPFPMYKYEAKLIRANKRHLAQLIFNNQDYIDVDDIQVYKM